VQNVEQSIPPAEPGKVMVPSTVEEVIAAVGAARAAGAKLRCISHGHTWTPVFFDPVSAPSCQLDPDMPCMSPEESQGWEEGISLKPCLINYVLGAIDECV
jgi:hypothetical protein